MTIASSKSDDSASTAVMGRSGSAPQSRWRFRSRSSRWLWAADRILVGIGDIENRDEMTSGTTENPAAHQPVTSLSRIVPVGVK